MKKILQVIEFLRFGGSDVVRYDILGFKSESEYINHFFNTLLKTNWTYEYFVDWKKVKENIKKYVKEISLLNSLTKIEPEERKNELKEIFKLQNIDLRIKSLEKSLLNIEEELGRESESSRDDVHRVRAV